MTEEAQRTADAQTEESEPQHTVDAARLAARLGRYQLVLPLAQGGMGIVFVARLVGGHGVERLVAIKTLRPITSKSDRTALLREARLTARLHHRNVVATIDLGEVDDVPYVVMDLVDGVPLSRLLGTLDKRGEHLTPELAGWIVMQAALGLHAAHELSDTEGRPIHLVHRDISPQNILLSLQGEVKIADFGIAKFAGREESTATGMIKGKFAYMSPEQAGSAELDRRSDLFALGIVLWEALTGARAFASDTPARTIMRVLEHTPRRPVDIRPEVGDEMSAIAMRCIAKDPTARFATAADVAEALRSALRTRGVPMDEADLATVMRTLFGEELARFKDRLRNESIGADGTTQTFTPPVEASELAAMSVSSGTPAAVTAGSRRLRVRLALALVAVLAGSGLVVWRLGLTDAKDGPAIAAGRSATPDPSAVPGVESASSRSATAPNAPPGAPASAPTASVSELAVPPPATVPSTRTRVPARVDPSRAPPRAASAKPATAPRPPTTAVPPASKPAPGGQPFDSL